MKCRVITVSVAAGLALSHSLASSALSQEPSATGTNRLPEVIVTGTRIPEQQKTTPTAVTVVTRDQIDQTQTHTVQDILRVVPGVEVTQTGQRGGTTSVFLRGANSEQTLVLVDGVRVNDPYSGGFDFGSLPVDNIERIEVLRGPQSTLYGSDAIGGVINIVTRRGAPTPTGSATVEGGSNNSLGSRGSFAGTFGKLSLAGETSFLSTDNERPNSEYRVWNTSIRASYQILERFDASLQGSYLKSHLGVPNDRFTNDPNDSSDKENSFVALTLHGEPTEWWDTRLQLSHAHSRATFDGPTPNPPWMGGPSHSLTISDRNQIDFQNVFRIGEQHKILAGCTFEHSPVDSLNQSADWGDNTIRRAIDSRALCGQYEFTPVSRFTATVGGRVDDFNSFGTHGTYRVGGRWTTPVTETILRASVGTGFRAPTVLDLYYPGFSNPNLTPETSLGWDIGIEQPLADGKLRLGATYFQNQYDDLIQFVWPMPVNIGKAETLGVETFAVWMPVTNLTLRGSYTWLPVAEDSITNQRLLRRATHGGSLSVNYRFLQRFSVYTTATFVGDRMDFDGRTWGTTENDGYVKVDLGLSCDVCKHFTVFVRSENLFDEKYEDAFGFPSLGRTVWGGGTIKF